MSNSTTSRSQDATPAAGALPDAPPSPVIIWLVDDDRCLRDTLKDILEKCSSVRCTAAFHSPNAVLSVLASKAGPDVILLDLQMCGASGLDAIRPIKALARTTQVVMLTSCFDDEAKRRALTNGASDFLLKRYPVERILVSIQQALKHPAPHLKRSRRPSPAAERTSETRAPRRPPKRRVWLENCLDTFRLRRN